eukprot:scaffold23379_cov71-Phaeocystis_antarctica.AAC.5
MRRCEEARVSEQRRGQAGAVSMRQPPVRGRLELHRGGRVLVSKDARSVTSAQHDGRTAALTWVRAAQALLPRARHSPEPTTAPAPEGQRDELWPCKEGTLNVLRRPRPCHPSRRPSRRSSPPCRVAA